MEIRFWGVRGSIPSPGPDTARTGGNTSCVEVRMGAERIVCDAGTGLRDLGRSLANSGETARASFLLSHYHWDHIQGLPFFAPLYMPGSQLEIIGSGMSSRTVQEALTHQMTAPVFPVDLCDVPARLATREVRPGTPFEVRGAEVRAAKLNHPGGVLAYRITHGGRSVVYATDTEHYACDDPALIALAKNADVLIYDAQYLPSEYDARVGWGHSTYEVGARVARAAGVGKLVLFHHDPARSDEGVDEIEALAQKLFPDTVAAREGLVLNVAENSAVHAA